MPLQFVGAALGDQRHIAAGDAAEFGGDARGHDLEFRHGVHARNLIRQPVRLSRIHHAAINVIVDGTGAAAVELKGVLALCVRRHRTLDISRQGDQGEGVAIELRQVADEVIVDDLADRRIRRPEHRRRCGHGNFFSGPADFKPEVERQPVADVQLKWLGLVLLEASQFRGDDIRPRNHARELKLAVRGADGPEFYPRLSIGDNDVSARKDSA